MPRSSAYRAAFNAAYRLCGNLRAEYEDGSTYCATPDGAAGWEAGWRCAAEEIERERQAFSAYHCPMWAFNS